MTWLRAALSWMRWFDSPRTVAEHKRMFMEYTPVIINGEIRHPELKRIYYGPSCPWPQRYQPMSYPPMMAARKRDNREGD